MDLFELNSSTQASTLQPLAERMRPKTLDEFVGQEHLLGAGKLLRELTEAGALRSLILWGPPGSGKTTLAQILARSAGAVCVHFSAVTSGVKDLKKIIQEAEEFQRLGKRTVLFVDEIHHFNKSQQDNFLPHVERGTLILIGATTENPSFEVISSLLSRCQVLVLNPLTADDIGKIVDRALREKQCGLGTWQLEITAEAREFVIQHSQGDCRVALNALENAANIIVIAKSTTQIAVEEGGGEYSTATRGAPSAGTRFFQPPFPPCALPVKSSRSACGGSGIVLAIIHQTPIRLRTSLADYFSSWSLTTCSEEACMT